MPTKKGEPQGSESPSIKDPELYEKLLDEGASKQKAARISNAGDYENWTVPELKARAKEIGLKGYSAKKKSELISALRNS
jgi:hypothetical protein